MSVQVLLSTHNGEPYLPLQMESLLAQDCPDVTILIRDDGSTDGTLALLREYAASHPQIRLEVGERLGFAHSFLSLVRAASPEAKYYAFCDQDDVWHPGKLSRAVAALEGADPETPTLYSARMTVTDANLRPVGPSILPRRGLSFGNALVECWTPGCASVINRSACRLLARGRPDFLEAHDGWAYLVVAAFGLVLYDETPAILHRRHAGNVTGYSIGFFPTWRRRIRRFLAGEERGFMEQARELQRIYGSDLSEERRKILDRFLAPRHGYRQRLRYALSGEVYRQLPLDHLLLVGFLLLDCL